MESEGTIICCAELFYDHFIDEWTVFSDDKKPYWSDFIKSKDLGLKLVSFESDTYKVIDEKKWFLAKIKYGI